jgi:hypothetical protein
MRNIALIAILCILSVSSCRNSDEKIKKTDLIQAEDLVPILVEMHIADGLLESVSMQMKYPGRDSISNYKDILAKHNVSKEHFDQTIGYYKNHPDKLNDVYEEVISELTKFQSELQQSGRQKVTEEQMINIWDQKVVWHLPDDGITNKIDFSIRVSEPGTYILTVTVRLHMDDGSKNPRISAYFWYNDGSRGGFRIPFESVPLKKNSRIRVYTLSLDLEDSRVTHIRGSLLDHDPQSGHWEKHADIMNVKLQVIPDQRSPVGIE